MDANSIELAPMQPSPRVVQVKHNLGIVGNAPSLNNAVERALKVAPIDLSVLVIGESGSGKEFFPQIIHRNSPRKHNKYIAVNCGAIPEGTIDSELFGHEKGAFTGAVASRKGYFEEADGGTIFLDEVAELPLTTQARLLRVLETGEFIKVGSSTVQKTNIRVVAATNVNMAQAVASGKFREDLYYRLSTVQIDVPPLRTRGNDIVLLARKFTTEFSERYHTPAITFDDNARRLMLVYPWPGNVRQLKNIVEQLALFNAGETIDDATLRSYLPQVSPGEMTTAVAAPARGYDAERDMLFNLIFRLRSEIDHLKSRLDHLEPEQQRDRNVHADTTELLRLNHDTDAMLPASLETHNTGFVPVTEVHNVEDVVPAEEPVTLEDTEKETIRRALRRHAGRRKPAADELKISERTLYRKIREYGLE